MHTVLQKLLSSWNRTFRKGPAAHGGAVVPPNEVVFAESMKKQLTSSKVRHRLTREENRAITRSKLIKMGRKHFLAHGYGGTVLEQVAEEAGLSRGALYSNFTGKEDLFLAVFETDLHMRVARFHDILDSGSPAESQTKELRAAFVQSVMDKDWGLLRTEFELGALRSETLRKRFVEIHRRDLRNSIVVAQKATRRADIQTKIPMDEFVLAAQSFMMGLSLKQRLLSRNLSLKKVQSIAEAFFDSFMTSRAGQDAKLRVTPPAKKNA
jgi:AcrR family transcriptional regulator